MNVSAPFIVRPIATTLLIVGVTLLGLVAYFVLPTSLNVILRERQHDASQFGSVSSASASGYMNTPEPAR
jgi:hypothetical protein